MRRTLPAAAVLLIAAALVPAMAGQVARKPDILGTWTGYAVSPGARFELTVVFGRTEAGYSGVLSDADGMIAETPLRDIVFKDGRVTCVFDLDMGGDMMFIKLEMALEGEVLKGNWFDAEGNSDVIELTLKK
ncbi:MAG: hypothetical protein MUE80_03810 [Acidobacteria bacterium]|jgi:hypothetical protein|nr:hypothetical protein [Acidobacteriota bacterium]